MSNFKHNIDKKSGAIQQVYGQPRFVICFIKCLTLGSIKPYYSGLVDEDVLQYEQYREDIHHRCKLLELTAKEVKHNVEDDTCEDTIRD